MQYLTPVAIAVISGLTGAGAMGLLNSAPAETKNGAAGKALMAPKMSPMDHAAHMKAMKSASLKMPHHKHAAVEAGDDGPSIRITGVRKDSASGYNVKVEVGNFRFRGDKVGGSHVPGEGHIHLFVNKKKVTRLYSAGWHHIPGPWLSSGKNTIRFMLSANTHGDYQRKGKPVGRGVNVMVDESEPHRH